MKNKKGFVFIETLIVTAILTFSLLMLYSTYSALIRSEKTRIRYNDSAYLYRTYYITNFLYRVSDKFSVVKSELDTPEFNSILMGFGCNSQNMSSLSPEAQGFCETIINDFHIRSLYLTKNDLSGLQNCTDAKGICETLNQVSPALSSFLKTIGGNGKQGYRIIIEFAESKDGTNKCIEEEQNCEFYYTTLSLGEI